MATTATATDTMFKAVDSAREQLTDSASKIGTVAMKEAGKLKDAVADSAVDLAGSATTAAKEQAGELQKLILREIQDRPLRAIGVALAIGLFLGWRRR
jgi:ElaB/YqjD/DUF883 family membrane-anchored ribosome-binding protein